MARRCELTGKAVQTGHNVSHAKNRNPRRFLPNVQKMSLYSDALGQGVRLKISAYALRTVEFRGGLDNFLMRSKDTDLSIKARRVKRAVSKKLAASEAAA